MPDRIVTSPIQSYYRVNPHNYSRLIEGLLAEAASAKRSLPADPQLVDARRNFFETAISKGTELSDLPAKIATLTPDELAKAAVSLPDKEAPGWHRITSLQEQDRQSFASAAERRTPETRWDNLFPAGQNEIVLPFSGSALSLDDKIQTFIADHNASARKKFTAARQQDEEARAKDPGARPTAGKTIEQREIRIDPSPDAKGSAKLQTLNPNKSGEVWEPGPKFGKFLQEQYQWELYDIYRRESEGKTGPEASAKKPPQANAALKDIANHVLQSADEFFDSDSLRVVISRDPQKIGEMSTGQRWRSCMACDGVNYHYVPRDIEAGSIVAYVVHADDPEARYPLMRQLIKPFTKDITSADGHITGRETILVPANLYGGDGGGNSRTRDGLRQTLNHFVTAQNAGKSGEFRMDTRLYEDGQVPVARLDGDWSPESIRNGMQKYQNGALQEWMVELNTNAHLLAAKKLGPHGEDPAENIKKLKNKISHVLTAQDTDAGLPRMFYNEMLASSVGSVPDPRDIHAAVMSAPDLLARETAFKALQKQDQVAWETSIAKLSPELRIQTAIAANMIAATPAQEVFAGEAIQRIIMATKTEGLTELEARLKLASDVFKKATPGSPLQNRMSGIILDTIPQFPTVEGRCFGISDVDALFANDRSANKMRLDVLKLDNIDGLPKGWGVGTASEIYDRYPQGSDLHTRAGNIALDHIKFQNMEFERYRAATKIFVDAEGGSPLQERAGHLALDAIQQVDRPAWQVQAADGLFLNATSSPALRLRAGTIILDHIAADKKTDIGMTTRVFADSKDIPALKERAGHVILDSLQRRLNKTENDYLQAQMVFDNSPDHPALHERAGYMILEGVKAGIPVNQAVYVFRNVPEGSSVSELARQTILADVHAMLADEHATARPLEAIEARYHRVISNTISRLYEAEQAANLKANLQVAQPQQKQVNAGLVNQEIPSADGVRAAIIKAEVLGKGSSNTALSIDGHPDFVVRMPHQYVGDTGRVSNTASPVDDPFSGRNFGQPVAEYGNGITVNRRQLGEPAGVPPYLRRDPANKPNNNALYERRVALAANMPDSAYIELLRDMQAVEAAGKRIDPSKANNLLIDSEGKRFNIVDLNDGPRPGHTYRNSPGELVVMLFDNSYCHHYDGSNGEQLDSNRRIILDKMLRAAETLGLPFEHGSKINSSLSYSLKLAGYAEDSPERAAIEARVLSTASPRQQPLPQQPQVQPTLAEHLTPPVVKTNIAPKAHTATRAGAGAGLGLGLKGLKDRLGDEGSYEKAKQVGGEQLATERQALAGDIASIATGAADMTPGIRGAIGVATKVGARVAPIVAAGATYLEVQAANTAQDGRRGAGAMGGFAGGMGVGMATAATAGAILGPWGAAIGGIVGGLGAGYVGSEIGRSSQWGDQRQRDLDHKAQYALDQSVEVITEIGRKRLRGEPWTDADKAAIRTIGGLMVEHINRMQVLEIPASDIDGRLRQQYQIQQTQHVIDYLNGKTERLPMASQQRDAHLVSSIDALLPALNDPKLGWRPWLHTGAGAVDRMDVLRTLSEYGVELHTLDKDGRNGVTIDELTNVLKALKVDQRGKVTPAHGASRTERPPEIKDETNEIFRDGVIEKSGSGQKRFETAVVKLISELQKAGFGTSLGDKDGVITPEKLAEAMKRTGIRPSEMDREGNGIITAQEAIGALRAHGLHLPEQKGR